MLNGGCGLLGDPEGDRGLLRDGNERVQLVIARAPAGLGLVDRDDPDQLALGVAERQ